MMKRLRLHLYGADKNAQAGTVCVSGAQLCTSGYLAMWSASWIPLNLFKVS